MPLNTTGTYTAETGRTAEKIPGNGTHLRIVPHDLIWADGMKGLNADRISQSTPGCPTSQTQTPDGQGKIAASV